MASALPADRWELTEKLFEEAVTLPPGARLAFLENRCGPDTGLRDEVLSLLQYDTGEEPTFLNALQFAAVGLTTDDIVPGATLGPYRIEREIGRGGMSVVYLAVRADGEFRKRVAIKLIKRGMDTDAVLARLRQERRILAALEHPSIARLLDGGTTASGRPWLAMEYVEGLPIHRFCEQQKLSRDDRARLISKVCDAVAYAHRNFVIHRDLKPANILVTPDGSPRLLDFGIAKLLDTDSDESNPETRGPVRALTPEYASPEQRLGARLGITSDVYSIGVILYELLTGSRPAGPDPASPHTRTDLDVVVMKALQPEPERRYQTADQFAEDLRCYLTGRPVAARPDTLGYRAAMFVRRNRVGVAAGAAVVLALAGGVIASSWEAREANLARSEAMRESALARTERDHALASEQSAENERNKALASQQTAESERNKAVVQQQRADREASTAKAISDFLQNDLLGQASPNAGTDPDLKVRTALDRAAERIEGKFKGKPLVEADIRESIAGAYFSLGIYPESLRQYELVRDLRRSVLGDRNKDTLDVMTSVAVLERVLGRLEDAERVYDYILPIERETLGERDPLTLLTMGNLAVVYSHEQKFAQAEELELKVLAIQKAVLGPEHLDTLRTMNNLGVDYTSLGRFDDAQRIYREVLEIRRHVQGPTHPNTIFTLNNLAVTYARPGGNFEAAEKLYQEALEDQRRALGPDHPDTLLTMSNLGLLWANMPGKAPDAERILRQTAEGRARALGPNHLDTLYSWVSTAVTQALQKKFSEAEATARPVCKTFAETKPDLWQRYWCETVLGASLSGQKRYSEAEPLLRGGYDAMIQRKATIPAASRAVITRTAAVLAQLYSEEAKPELADEWRRKSVSP